MVRCELRLFAVWNTPQPPWEDERMTEISIRLPTGVVIGDCEWRVRTFVERDAYVRYDWDAGHGRGRGDLVRKYHVEAANRAMKARSSYKGWENFYDLPLPELDGIPDGVDLIESPVGRVKGALSALVRVTERIAAVKGLTEMAVSKVVHLLRPKFVPIADSYVRDAVLGGWRGQAADTIARVARAVRELGDANAKSLERLARFANALPSVVPGNGCHRGGSARVGEAVPVRLSKVRILDILIWTEGALNGPTPHKGWTKWHAEFRSRG
jgi:hypothetical protein